jgi:hypothetical protein
LKERKVMSDTINSGIGMGAVMAMIISWSMNQSFWWMLLHGLCGWLYLIYWGIKY